MFIHLFHQYYLSSNITKSQFIICQPGGDCLILIYWYIVLFFVWFFNIFVESPHVIPNELGSLIAAVYHQNVYHHPVHHQLLQIWDEHLNNGLYVAAVMCDDDSGGGEANLLILFNIFDTISQLDANVEINRETLPLHRIHP